MAKRTVQDVLWENVVALMREKWGKENLNRLVRESRIGPGTASRLKERKTSVGIDVIEKVAAAFAVQPWTLLFPFEGAKKLLDFCAAWEKSDQTGKEILIIAADAALQAQHGASRAAAGRSISPHGGGVGVRSGV